MPCLGPQARVRTRNVIIAAQRSDSLSNALTRSAIPVSPVLFTVEIFMRMNSEVSINISGARLRNLRFTGDIAPLAESEEKLTDMLEDLNNEGKKDGMKLNKKKTKIMCYDVARKRLRTGVMIDGEQLEEVTAYKYIRRLVTSGNELSKETGQRMTSGWRRFWEYNHFWRDRKIPICLNRKILDTVILPAITYGAETWTLTKLQERKLAVAQRSMERLLFSITNRDKILNEVIRSNIKMKDIMKRVQCMGGQRAGHVARMNNTRWARITLEWTPREGRRVKRRPRRRWRDNTKEVGSSQWMKVAQDWSAWRGLHRPSASKGMNGWEGRKKDVTKKWPNDTVWIKSELPMKQFESVIA